jgi:hypothetical protein
LMGSESNANGIFWIRLDVLLSLMTRLQTLGAKMGHYLSVTEE